MVVELPDDHHCPWRELCETMEQRFTAVLKQQQDLIGELQRRLQQQSEEHKVAVLKLEGEVQRLSRELFGRKSEKIKIPSVERDSDPPSDEELERRKQEAERKRRERALLRDAVLEQQDVQCPVPESLKHCPHCGGTQFGELPPQVTYTIEYIPGRFVRRRNVQHKAACRCGGFIVTAPAPPKLIAKGLYGPGFAAYLIVAKCADSIPIYRIEKRMQRLGIPISRSSMNDVLHSGAEVLEPLIRRLTQRIAKVEIVLADETSVRLQTRDKRSFIWVFHGHDDSSGGELVLYVFALDRSGKTPAQILGGSEGTLVCDGYTGYNVIEDPEQRKRGGCWCHGRRRFFEAQSTAPDEAQHVITQMRALFRVEHEATIRGIVGSDQHLALRQERSRPIVDKLFEWLVTTKDGVLPKSPIGTAIGYMLNQRQRLELFLSDPRVPMHNNGSENRLRVVALGRKNFLFFGHQRAGRNFAGLYSLVGSCIANDIEPTAYLTDVMMRVGNAETDDDLDALLPDRWARAQ